MVKFVKKRQWSHYILLLANSDSTNYKHFRNILRLFDVLPNFPSTTSKTMRDCPVPPQKNENFANTSKNPLKSRKQPPPTPAVPRPTGKPELAPNILQIIVART